MHTLIFDIETNPIEDWLNLTDVHTIHCLAIKDVTEDEVKVYDTSQDNILEGIDRLQHADIIVGHNAHQFDIPAIKRVCPEFKFHGMLRDTLLMSRLCWSDLGDDDWKRKKFPRELIGSHSLKAWGHRLSLHKGDFTDFDEWTPEMNEYCMQDVEVTCKLWKEIEREHLTNESVELEHCFAEIIRHQEKTGFGFDLKKAQELHATLLQHKAGYEEQLQDIFPPTIIEMKTPSFWYVLCGGHKVHYKTKSLAKQDGHRDSSIFRGDNKKKIIPFNPGSRDQIAKCLINKYNWKPEAYTPSGQPKIDESILKALPYEEAEILCKYLTVSKRLGQLAEGKQSWMTAYNEITSAIHGRVNTNGAVTGRCTHNSPNLGQVPAINVPFGKQCRELFVPPIGYKYLCGWDASGLELRMLGHFMAYFDEGAYSREVCEGDIHTLNKNAAGLSSRSQAKTMIYALCYGAGPTRLGKIINGSAKDGKELQNKFYSKIPALKKLRTLVEYKVKTKGYLEGLDGRKLPCRSAHSALNTLLQSAGAVVMKDATINMWAILMKNKLLMEVAQVAHIHDEVQLACTTKEIAHVTGKAGVSGIELAGRNYELKCPLTGEYNVGRNWAETH